MDRVEFIKSIENSDIDNADLLSKFFDQCMILYNLIEHVDNIKILNLNETSVSFQLYFSDTDILNSIIERLKTQSMILIYDKCYSIAYSNITNNTFDIMITLM